MLQNLQSYLTIKEAAEFLGVSPKTLRYWDRTGKLKPNRHPLSSYRLYRRDQLEEILRQAAGEQSAPCAGAGPTVNTRTRAAHPTRGQTSETP